jgi:phage shock protein PspC (stress-responsive transcriptional regulator)
VTDRLYRSRDDRMLTGVAGGVADSLDTDPSLVRIAWVILAFLTGGIAVIVYIVMAIVVPEAPAGTMTGATAPAGVSAGSGPAGSGPTGGDSAAAVPPSLPHRRDPGDRARGGLVLGALLIVVGGLFLIRQLLPSLDFGLLWPIAAIGLGVLLIIVAITPSRHSG